MDDSNTHISIRLSTRDKEIIVDDIDPESPISTLYQYIDQEFFFIYEYCLLNAQISFKSYNIANNSTIYCIKPYKRKIPTDEENDLELEKIRVKEFQYLKAMRTPKAFRSIIKKFDYENINQSKQKVKCDKKVPEVIPPKLDRPLTCPLPMVWNKDQT